jgi:S-DNA-T family DNA segregation ATPase FtsK/SpoIIIE
MAASSKTQDEAPKEGVAKPKKRAAPAEGAAPPPKDAPPPVTRGKEPPKDKKPPKELSEAEKVERAAALRRGGEIIGLLLVSLAAALILSIASFHAEDLAMEAGQHRNLIGPVGTYAAEILLYTMGIGSFFFVGVLFLLGGFLLVGRRPDLKPSEFVGYALLLLGGAVLFHFLFLGEQVLDHQAGGVLGQLLGEALRSFIGLVGAYLFASCLCVLSVTLITDRSVGEIVLWIGGRLRGMFDGVSLKVEAEREFQRRLKEMEGPKGGSKKVMDRQEALEAEVAARLERHKEQLAHKRSDSLFGLGRKPKALPEPAEEAAPPKKGGKALPAPEKAGEKAGRLGKEAGVGKEAAPGPSVGVGPSVGSSKGKAPVQGKLDLGEMDLEALEAEFGLPREPLVRLDDEDDDEDDEGGPETLDGEVAPAPARQPAKPVGGVKLPALPEPGEGGPAIVETEAQRLALERQERLMRGGGGVVRREQGEFKLPSLDYLDYEAPERTEVDEERLHDMAALLEEKLASFGVQGKIVEIRQGPVITMFEFAPAAGVKLSRIAGLSDDLAMALSAHSVRIIAPIPGKGVVGIEVPNDVREKVFLKEILIDEVFQDSKARMPMALGKDTEGNPVVTDLTSMPHLLVAGTTGSGKSVAVNTMIVSLLFRFTPEEVRFIMVDPKMLEFNIYEGIPHLLLPIVTDPQKAAAALTWGVAEMERRYHLLAEMGVRNIVSYNKRVKALAKQCEQDLADGLRRSEAIDRMQPDDRGELRHKALPCIVCIIDEFADLMMVASKDVETGVARLAQKARAAGIHLILATQRPSVDVITGLIKANFPTRIALRVAQKIDSRTILDSNGAETLLGKGDMLFLPPGSSQQQRVHGAFVTEEEIERIVAFLKAQGSPEYDESILMTQQEKGLEDEEDDFSDEFYDEAIRIVTTERIASISMIQRKLRIGYNRAARLVEKMAKDGIVGPGDGSKPREVLAPPPP